MIPLRITLVLCVLLLQGCAPFNTRVDYNHSVQFDGLNTYAWVSQEALAEGYISLDQQRIRAAFEQALKARGMVPVKAEDAQVWVDASYQIDRRYESRTNYYGYYNWRPYWWGMQPEVSIDERDESHLGLLMIDPATRSVIWAGQSTLRYYQDQASEKRQESLINQVNAVMARFPPP